MPDAVSNFYEECKGIRGDLSQIQGLLHDAIGKLTEHFQSLESDSVRQLQLIEALTRGMRGPDEPVFADIDTISSINKDISSHVGSAVTVLQFEDLCQQLIAKLMLRMNQMEKTISIFEGQDSDEVIPQPKAVRIPCIAQKDMAAGSVELF